MLRKIVGSTRPQKVVLKRDPIKIFGQLSDMEIRNSIRYLFSFLAERGCMQTCKGCHSGAYGKKTTGTWDNALLALNGISAGMKKLNIEPERDRIEPFRDNDPSWLRFPDQPLKGIGDLGKAIYDNTGRKIKIMTSGVMQGDLDFAVDQYKIGAPYIISTSVSVTAETFTYRTNPEQDIIAKAALLDGFIVNNNETTPIFLDIHYRNQYGTDDYTMSNIDIMKKIIGASQFFPKELLEIDYNKEDGSQFHKVEAREKPFGKTVAIRIDPYMDLNTVGRGVLNIGQNTDLVQLNSDWLAPLDAQENTSYPINHERYTGTIFSRKQLRENLVTRSRFIEIIRELSLPLGGRIGNRIIPKLNGLLRSEFDITPAIAAPDASDRWAFLGMTTGAFINLLISNWGNHEMQEVIPWMPLELPE